LTFADIISIIKNNINKHSEEEEYVFAVDRNGHIAEIVWNTSKYRR